MNDNDNDIKNKIEKSIEIICTLYKNQLITDGYIIGSVAKETAKKESDIDLVLVNPRFEFLITELDGYSNVTENPFSSALYVSNSQVSQPKTSLFPSWLQWSIEGRPSLSYNSREKAKNAWEAYGWE